MRLIDADRVKSKIVAICASLGYTSKEAKTLWNFIDQQPTAFDLNKVLGEMHKSIESSMNGAADITGAYWNKGIEHCISIVERGGRVE